MSSSVSIFVGQHNNRRECETVIQTFTTCLDPQRALGVDRYRHVSHRDPKQAKKGKRKIRKKIVFWFFFFKVWMYENVYPQTRFAVAPGETHAELSMWERVLFWRNITLLNTLSPSGQHGGFSHLKKTELELPHSPTESSVIKEVEAQRNRKRRLRSERQEWRWPCSAGRRGKCWI